MSRLLSMLVILGLLMVPGQAQEGEEAAEKMVRVAVFNVGSVDDELKSTAEKVGPLLQTELSSNPDMELVERDRLHALMEEQRLSVTGLVDEDAAVKVAQLAGADVLVMGRIFELDEELVFSVKIMGVETSRVFAKVVKGKLTDPLAPLVSKMAKEIGKVVVGKRAAFFAKRKTEEDPLPLIRKAIEGKKLPRIYIKVAEQHVTKAAVDPTVQTEMMGLLNEAGFTVYDPKSRELSDWADEFMKTGAAPPRNLEKVDVVIVGEAFSEFGAQQHGMFSCKGRIEIKAVDNKTGEILAVGRVTHRALDMSEMIAAKSALEKGSRKLAPDFIGRMVTAWDRTVAEETKEEKPAEKKEEAPKKK